MKNRFIVIVNDDITAEQENAISDYLKNSGYLTWHWIHNIWLVIAQKTKSHPELRTEIKQQVKGIKQIIVLPCDGKFAVSLPVEQTEWIRNKWSISN